MVKAVLFVCLMLSMVLQRNGITAVKESRPSTKDTDPVEIETTKTGRTDSIDPDVNSPRGDTGPTGFRGRLLVIPMDGSHWFAVKAVAQEMGRRGHQVTVVIPEFSMRMGPGQNYNTVTYPVPYGQEEIDTLMDRSKENLRRSESSKSFFRKICAKIEEMERISAFILTTAEMLLFNTSLISHLSEQNYDAVLTDPMIPTGSLIARKLGIPSINVLRGIPCGMDLKAAACPSPPSYVPRFFTRYTDNMTYRERVINTVVSLLEPLRCRLLYWRFDHIASEFLGEDVGVAGVLADSAIWLLRYDFTLEFPRPLMPNMVLVAGINCIIRNPLPEDLESWLDGHAFVVFTLGSMVSLLPEELTAIFLDAFRQIPEKVLWRYTGAVPDHIPENVKMMKWLPQNDLLAHHGVRAFITHGGTHGLYEGVCHAVPMLMLPLNGDQPDNAHRLASRGVGVVLDIHTITVESLLQGLNDVISNTRYKDNAMKLSALHKDRPMDPLDLSVFWTEFVMRHKGAEHLRVAAHDLNWFQYHSMDVIVLLVTGLLSVIIGTVKCMKLCLRKIKRVKSKKE